MRNRLGKNDTIEQSIEKLTARIAAKNGVNNNATKKEKALDLTGLFLAHIIKNINDATKEKLSS